MRVKALIVRTMDLARGFESGDANAHRRGATGRYDPRHV